MSSDRGRVCSHTTPGAVSTSNDLTKIGQVADGLLDRNFETVRRRQKFLAGTKKVCKGLFTYYRSDFLRWSFLHVVDKEESA